MLGLQDPHEGLSETDRVERDWGEVSMRSSSVQASLEGARTSPGLSFSSGSNECGAVLSSLSHSGANGTHGHSSSFSKSSATLLSSDDFVPSVSQQALRQGAEQEQEQEIANGQLVIIDSLTWRAAEDGPPVLVGVDISNGLEAYRCFQKRWRRAAQGLLPAAT